MKFIRHPFFFFIAVLLLSRPIFSQQLIKGPYVQNVQQDRATICWVTQNAVVKYGPEASSLSQSKAEIQVHEMLLDNLSANTQYYYDIGFGEESKGHFKTAPEYGAPFRFVVLGDTRFAEKPKEIQKKIITAIERQKPALVINTGDLVTNGLNPIHWDTFFSMNAQLLKTTPYYVALGNHEKDSHFFYQYFSFPGKEDYYSFDWSNCHFIVLDSEGPHYIDKEPLNYQQRKARKKEMENFWDKQLTWLCNDLEKHRNYDFTFVFMHQPLFSLKESRRQEQKEFQKRFAEIFNDFKVTIVFSGHDHNYQRHYVNPVHYIVTAGGGAGLYELGKPFAKYTRKVAIKHHYVLVEVDGKKLTSTALTADGEVLDRLTIPFDNRKDWQRAEKELHLNEVGTYDTWY